MSLQSAAVEVSFSDNLTPLGVSFILLAIVSLNLVQTYRLVQTYAYYSFETLHHIFPSWTLFNLNFVVQLEP